MDVLRYGFLVATLGEDGATALSKAAERSPVLGPVLVPRAILAWLQLQQDANYEGELPGVTNSYLSFQKASGFQKTLTTGTPTPDSFTGVIAVGDKSYGFEDASALQLAASIGIALGVDADQLDPSLRDVDLRRLGHSIDLLAKARRAVEDIMVKRMLDPSAGYIFGAAHHEGGFVGPANTTTVFATHPSYPGEHVGEATFSHNPDGKTLTPELSFVHQDHRRQGLASAIYAHAEKVTGKKVVPSQMQSENAQGLWAGNQQKPQFGLGKADAPGPAAPPQKQGAPEEAAPPAKQPMQSAKKPAMPKPGKGLSPLKTQASGQQQPAMKADLPQVKLTRSQAQRPCPVCGTSNFSGERLTGCLCFEELAKNADATRTSDGGYLVTFGSDWDGEDIEVFLGGLQGRSHAI